MRSSLNTDKEKLREQLNKQTVAYINSGGQIQRCPPCTYGEVTVVTPAQKKKMGRLFGTTRNRWDKT